MDCQAFSLDALKVIVGLGNPGPKFALTRHNIGFLFVDHVAAAYGASWRAEGIWQVAVLRRGSQSILLIKPQTFMNASGDVWPLLAKKGVQPEHMLVVHDELEKKGGTFQIRCGGSARGHNGLRSLIGRCGENFWRLRLGIDRPGDKAQVSEYVLQRFTPAEQAGLDAWLALAARAVGL